MTNLSIREKSSAVAPTERISAPRRIPTNVIIVLAGFAGVFLARYVGGDAGVALAAFGCAGILVALAPKHIDDTSDHIYYWRIGSRIVRLYGDAETDRYFEDRA